MVYLPRRDNRWWYNKGIIHCWLHRPRNILLAVWCKSDNVTQTKDFLSLTYFYVVHRWIGVGSAAQRVLDDINVFVKKIIRIRYFEYLHRRFDRRFQVNWSSVVDGGGWNHSHVAFQNKVKSNADLAWNFNCFELSAVTFSQFSFSDLQHISLFSLMLRFRRRLFPLLLPLPLLRRSCTAASWTSSSQR